MDATTYHGIYPGTIADVADPERRGRVRVLVPGLIDAPGAWALPRAGGSKNWGSLHIPPVGSDVYVQFLSGNPSVPLWEPGPWGDGETLPEHADPAISVWGEGPFRLAVDTRQGQEVLRFQVVKMVGGSESPVIELEVNAATNSVRLYGTTAVQIESGGILDLDAPVTQVRGRKILPNSRPLS